MDTRELRDRAFRCLPGCGFCCTFPPEVSRLEMGRLRTKLAPRAVPVTVGNEGRSYLALQNSCGACALLSAERGCTAYDERPAHCRYFPFHVHFGDATEVAVNETCRGVEHRAGDDITLAFRQSVLDVAKPAELDEHARAGVTAYAEFERRAKRAGAWGSADAATQDALRGPLFTGDAIEALTRAAGEPLTRAEAHADAMAPFAAADITKRPFYLAADLQWLSFERRGDALLVSAMGTTGALTPRETLEGLFSWAELDVAEALRPYLRDLAARASFVGGVYAIVDDSDYETSVEQAARWRVAEVAADLVARARVLRALGVDDISAETRRFYDSEFLDAPTIGGWL